MQVRRHGDFVVAVAWLGRGAGATVVRGDDEVAGLGERRDDMSELIRSLGKPMDQKDGAFELGGLRRMADNGVDKDFGWRARLAGDEEALTEPAAVVKRIIVEDRHFKSWLSFGRILGRQ